MKRPKIKKYEKLADDRSLSKGKNEIQKKEDPVTNNVAPRTVERPTAGSEYRDAVKIMLGKTLVMNNLKEQKRWYSKAGTLCLILAFLIVGCGKNDLSKNDQPSQTATVADVEDIKVTQKAEQVAETVRQKARVSEKAEGSQDLVKDKVSVTKTI